MKSKVLAYAGKYIGESLKMRFQAETEEPETIMKMQLNLTSKRFT